VHAEIRWHNMYGTGGRQGCVGKDAKARMRGKDGKDAKDAQSRKGRKVALFQISLLTTFLASKKRNVWI
jgi:hypothetical protein